MLRRPDPNTRRPRKTFLTQHFDPPARPFAVSVSGDLRRTVFLDQNGTPLWPSWVTLETAYWRPKKPKVLHKLHPDPAFATHSPIHSLLKYDLVVAIDTNTRSFGADLVSATAFAKCRLAPRKAGGVDVEIEVDRVFEFRNIRREKPECVGWFEVIWTLLQIIQHRPHLQVGLLVDSELGGLERFNARGCPLIEGFLLPHGFELNYASGEAGLENSPNQMLALCDTAADQVLDQIAATLFDTEDLVEAVGKPYSHFRLWAAPETILPR